MRDTDTLSRAYRASDRRQVDLHNLEPLLVGVDSISSPIAVWPKYESVVSRMMWQDIGGISVQEESGRPF